MYCSNTFWLSYFVTLNRDIYKSKLKYTGYTNYVSGGITVEQTATNITHSASDLLSSSALPSSLSLMKLSMFITSPFSCSIRLMLSLKASETPANCRGCVRYCHIITLINWSAALARSSHFWVILHNNVTITLRHNLMHLYNLICISFYRLSHSYCFHILMQLSCPMSQHIVFP